MAYEYLNKKYCEVVFLRIIERYSSMRVDGGRQSCNVHTIKVKART